MLSRATRTRVIAVVTTVWACNFFASVFLPGYQPSESINGIFMVVVGGLFALNARASEKDENEDDEEPPKKRARGGKKS